VQSDKFQKAVYIPQTHLIVAVTDFNLLVAESDTEGDVSVPVAEWLSSVRTASRMSISRKACLLFDLYLDRDVFHRVSFKLIYRTADSDAVEERPLFSISNDGVSDRVKDKFQLSLDAATSRYQVTPSVYCITPHQRRLG